LENALEEFKQGVLTSNDRAGSHLGLGYLHASRGDLERARAAYETAIRVEPRVSGPRSNLAELCDQLAEAAMRRADQARQRGSETRVQQAVGEAERHRERARQLRREELDNLERDARLLPESPDVQHRYGMLLYLHRKMEDAERALAEAHRLDPNNPRFLMGLVLFHKELGQRDQALPLAQKLVTLRPRDATYRAILEEVRAMPERE
jgi:Flp pilus assembly protein TadD